MVRSRRCIFHRSWALLGIFPTPDDYKQGSTVKIIYLHVPAALIAINAWFMMLVASLIWLIRRHHVSALRPRRPPHWYCDDADYPDHRGALGATDVGHMVGLGSAPDLILILFLFYIGYVALWAAIDNPDTAADLTSVLCMVGSVFAVLSRYAVLFWNQDCIRGRHCLSTRKRMWQMCFTNPC